MPFCNIFPPLGDHFRSTLLRFSPAIPAERFGRASAEDPYDFASIIVVSPGCIVDSGEFDTFLDFGAVWHFGGVEGKIKGSVSGVVEAMGTDGASVSTHSPLTADSLTADSLTESSLTLFDVSSPITSNG